MRQLVRCWALVAVSGCGGAGAGAQDTTADSDEATSTITSTTTTTSTSTSTSTFTTTTTFTTTATGDESSGSSATTDQPTGSESGTVVCDDLQTPITGDGMRVHLEALDAIAIANGNNRAVGTPGYDASIEYVHEQLTVAGYEVVTHEIELYVFSIDGPMDLTWEGHAALVELTDYRVPAYSAAGNISAIAEAVDVDLGPGNASTSGCEAADFAMFSPGNIAVLQRGDCEVADKILNAQDAGAVGVIVFNQGDAADTTGLWWTNLGALTEIQVPILLTTYALGAEMAQAPAGSVALGMDVDVTHELRPTQSLVVETASGDPDEIIMLGAHLDSVPTGPGINDNGSGVTALLELARAVHDCETTRKIRFAWWGAEEVGLVGSTLYVESLDAIERDKIMVYMNFDMIGSPNYARFRYDGDGSTFEGGPMGSAELEQVFLDYFDGQGIESAEIAYGGRSDYVAFVANGIAAGGLFTGAEGIKTDTEVEAHGGAANEPYDACYHLSCDGADNVDLVILESTARAIAYAIELYALP